MSEYTIMRTAAAVPFDKTHPGNPVNRRISILVMTKEAEKAALSRDLAVVDTDAHSRTGKPQVAQMPPPSAEGGYDVSRSPGTVALAVPTLR